MRYYKNVENGYIIAIGTGGGGTEITESEYEEIFDVIQHKPQRTETLDYHLRVDLTWEEYDRPPEPEPDPDEEIDSDELANILLGDEQ